MYDLFGLMFETKDRDRTAQITIANYQKEENGKPMSYVSRLLKSMSDL